MGVKLRNAVARLERAEPNLSRPLRFLASLVIRSARAMLGSVVSATDSGGLVGLTFDDGPDEAETERILELLADRRAHASFFMLVGRAETRPDLVRRIVDEGHDACLHGVDHSNLTRFGFFEVLTRMRRGKSRLQQLTGTSITMFRPPYGAQNLRSYVATRLAGLMPVVWSTWGDDWEEHPPAEIVRRAMHRLEPGGIVLLHDGFEPNPDHPQPRPTYDRVEMVSSLLDEMGDRGLVPTTVSNLLARGTTSKSVWFES